MFSTAEKIKSRTGQNKVGRFKYLKLLKEEFKITKSQEAKQQTIANLANFAYDPINYEHLRTLGIIDLFLEQLSEEDHVIIQFALGGICNLALEITSDINVVKMLELSKHPDKRVQNLAEIFLEDYCSGEQIHRVRNSVSLIPLPSTSSAVTE